MSGKQPFGSPPTGTTSHYNAGAPKYINDFTKALAGEVRMLLEEVGKLRDERRGLQQEISELMAMKSKHGAGGEYTSTWLPPPPVEEPPPPPVMEAPPPDPGPPAEAPSGWRVVHKRKERTPKAITAPPPATPMVAPTPVIPPDPPASKMPAWAQWRPNPHYRVPTPQPAPPPPVPMSPPPRAGLFGPSTPPP